MPEPNLLHQEEIIRIFFPEYGLAGNGFAKEDASIQSKT